MRLLQFYAYTVVLWLLFGFEMNAYAQAPPPAPTITAVTPATICQGDVVTITGAGFTNVSSVQIGSGAAKNYTVNSPTQITATAGDNVGSGLVIVTTQTGQTGGGTSITVNPAPQPALQDMNSFNKPFTNCDGKLSYTLKVGNQSVVRGSNNLYTIDWGDGTTPFTQTDWPSGATTSHTFGSQGYFVITVTIKPPNGCIKSTVYKFYNGSNPLASISTTSSTAGLCAPALIEFKIDNWNANSPGTTYHLDFGDGEDITLQHPLNGTGALQLVPHTYTRSSCSNGNFIATLNTINGCFTTTYTVNQIIIWTKPKADFIASTPTCINSPVTFTNKSTNGTAGNSCSTSTDFHWNFGDGTTYDGPTPPPHTFPAATTYNVTLSASNGPCGSDMITKQIVVLPISPSPTVTTPPTYCQGDQVLPPSATGTNLLWYNLPGGGTGSSTAPTPPQNTGGTFTYYVTQTLPNSCESPRTRVDITVNRKPNAPVVNTPLNLCLNQTTGPLTATGTGLKWYDNNGNTLPAAPTPPTSAETTLHYWVSQTVNGCEGGKAEIVVNIGPLAREPVVTTPLTYCQGQSAPRLTAGGTNLLWYNGPTGGTGSSAAPIPATSAPGSTSYYVSQTTGCGEGPRAEIKVIVNAGPSATISYTPGSLCNVSGAPSVAVTHTGDGGGAYSIFPATGLSINTATGIISPAGAMPGTYTITYTIPASPPCAAYSTSATVTVSSTPSATISYPAMCSNDGVTNVTLTGSRGGTFSAAAGLTIDAHTGAINPAASTPGTYSVSYDIPANPPCGGFSTTTNITITKAPSATITYAPAVVCNKASSTPVTVTRTGDAGGTYSVSPTGLPTDLNTGTITPANAIAGTYTIKYTLKGNGGCADYTTSTTVTVNSTPTATISYPALCSNDGVTNVILTGSSGGTFSADAGLTINAGTGAITPGTSTPGTHTVKYNIAPVPPCDGFSISTQVIITAAPNATISYVPALCNTAGTPAAAVTLTGSTGGTYSVTPAGLPIDPNTGTLSPAGARAGTYTVRYSIKGSGGCADYNTTTTVIVNSTPTATISYAGPFCGSENTPQLVTLNGTTGGSFSAGAGLSLNSNTGAINPAASTPGSYTVTYTIAPAPPCPGFSTVTTVLINESPVINFASPAQAICSGETAVFTPTSTVANTRYQWAVSGPLPAGVSGSSSGTATGPISLSYTNTGTLSRTLSIVVTPVNPVTPSCAGAPYTLTLTVRAEVPAPVTDTANFCMGAPGGALQVTPLPGNTVLWYDVNGAPLAAAPQISTNNPAKYIYFVSQRSSDGCESVKTPVVAVVHATARIVSSSYADPTACGIPSGNITLHVLDLNNNALPDIPVLVHYTRFQTALTVPTSTDANGTIVLPLTAGSYSDISVETTGGCPSQTIPDVFVLKDPSPPAQPVAGYNPPICTGTPLSLTALSATAGDLQYVWAGPAFGPEPDTSTNTVVTFPNATIQDAGTYVVYAMQHNCISLPANFEVAITQGPSKPLISTRNPLCVGDQLDLQAFSSIPGNSGLTYLWKGPAEGFPVQSNHASIDKVKTENAGIYTITVRSDATGCESSTDTTIEIGGYPKVQFAQDSLSLPTGYRLQLQPVITNADSVGIMPITQYTWIPADGLDCNDPLCAMPTVTVKENACYTVTATNAYGCSGVATLCLQAFCKDAQVFVANAFAPTGNIPDNRRLYVKATGVVTVQSFIVFNRWGKIVFERSNFQPNDPAYGWDGFINGKVADTGVYVYMVKVICENGTIYTIPGNTTLF